MAAATTGAEWASNLLALGEAPGQQRCKEALGPAAGPVCVTGASGFIALHLVSQLLERGYSVVGTVRSTSNEVKMAPLKELQRKYGAEKLRIVGGVDCMKPETFADAIAGCAGVFHTASPFHFQATDVMKELVEPAFQGTVGCLEACKKAGCVKRVLVTSSFAAIFNPGKYPWDYAYSSKDWNTVSCPDKNGVFPEPVPAHGYRYSKIVAEKAAWEFAARSDCPFDVVCINPPMVIGHNYNSPTAVEDMNTSSQALLKILSGKQAPNPNSICWVDAADVATSHILGYEYPEAGGRRFLCAANEVPLWTEIAQWMKELYPHAPVITEAPADGAGVRMAVDTAGLQALGGFKFRPLRSTLQAQCDSLLSHGWAKL